MQHESVRHLTIKMFEDLTGLSPEIVEEIFEFRDKVPYKLRLRFQFHFPPVQTVFNGTENVKFLPQKVWELVHTIHTDFNSTRMFNYWPKKYGNLFQMKKGNWRVFLEYIYRIGFLISA